MNLQAGGFDWDDGNRSKCEKHGVSIAEIEALFLQGPRVAPDPKHSAGEGSFDCGGESRHRKAAICGFYDAYEGRSPADPTSDGSVHACQGDSRV